MKTKNFESESICIADDIVRKAIERADKALKWVYWSGVIGLALLISLLLNTF